MKERHKEYIIYTLVTILGIEITFVALVAYLW